MLPAMEAPCSFKPRSSAARSAACGRAIAPGARRRRATRRCVPASWQPWGAPDSIPAPPGYLCEQCLGAPAVAFVAAPWGGEMGICEPCAGLPPAVPAATWDAVPACLICAQPPGPDEDATAYVQHCFDTGHPLRPGEWQIRRGTRS